MAFSYVLMLVLTCVNIWNYLIKRQMYKSYPLCVAYVLLLLISTTGVVYELVMGIYCGDNDCINDLLDEHSMNDGSFILLFWAIRQQLVWSMGVLQSVIMVVLILRID